MSKRFFARKLDLARSKGDGPRVAICCCSSKAPSTYTSAATVLRLASTTRVLRYSSDLFSKAFVTARTPVQKRLQKQNCARLPLEPLEVSGAANEWLPLIVEKAKLLDSYTSVALE
jgi:hypothetical protein